MYALAHATVSNRDFRQTPDSKSRSTHGTFHLLNKYNFNTRKF
ncbi:Hypothetical Protein XCAW_00351 [Xanthomonas citri subsp. citri Aw12879]|nr:Hypothetical Protein XCAW_00351 [Xanthomonas citri subsp. citri Aw12879]CEE89410.1 hypothetical protein XAC3218_950034 [Xanthomonas citri pv. citri]CEI07241.1 hypothetical protein XACG115_2280007 [Xanthomonas citri pv. citri]CEI15765.1 hypothetical protein XACB302_8870004 [Xanthomonas citri pv. citri]